jgi:hypothetical protein
MFPQKTAPAVCLKGVFDAEIPFPYTGPPEVSEEKREGIPGTEGYFGNFTVV